MPSMPPVVRMLLFHASDPTLESFDLGVGGRIPELDLRVVEAKCKVVSIRRPDYACDGSFGFLNGHELRYRGGRSIPEVKSVAQAMAKTL